MKSKRTRTAVVWALLLLGSIRTECLWERLGGPVLLIGGLLILMLFLIVLAKFGIALTQAIRQDRESRFRAFVPALIYLFAMLDAAFNPLGVTCEVFRSPVVDRACYEGTMNYATVKLRANQRFEIQGVGTFGYSTFHTGEWRREGDTLYLDFRDPKPDRLPETYTVERDSLWVATERNDGARPLTFYRGYCRGLN